MTADQVRKLVEEGLAHLEQALQRGPSRTLTAYWNDKFSFGWDSRFALGEPPEFGRVTGNPSGHIERLKAFVQQQGVKLEYEDEDLYDDMDSACDICTRGVIMLPNGLTPAAEFSMLAEELADKMLHRRDGEQRPSETVCEIEDEAVREIEDKAVASVVCQAIGLKTGAHFSDYIQLRCGEDTLAASRDRIHQTAAEILTALYGAA